MSERVGAAKRRRHRRLRAWHRHEQLTVAMELAAALHHSAQRPKTVVEEPKEEVENVTRDGLRAQKSPPPGVRPGSLFDPRPQRSDRTVRRSAGADPSLTLVSLAGGDAMDDTTVAFLLNQAMLAHAREEQAREKVKEAMLARAREEQAREKERKKAEAKERKRLKAAEEEEEKMQALNARMLAGEPLSVEEWLAWARWSRPPPQPSSSSSSGLKRK